MDWVDYLKIPDFKGIFARDSPDHLHRTGCCVINLDDGVGKGTHWVASFIKSKIIYYFDSFSLPPPVEFVDYARRLGMSYQHNYGYPIQNICRFVVDISVFIFWITFGGRVFMIV